MSPPRPAPGLDELAAHPATWLAAALVVVLLAHAAWARWRLGAGARASRRRNERALRGQLEAEALCERMGYRVVAVQPEFSWPVRVDGEPRRVVLRPDLLVERGGRTYVADVKTGAQAPDPLNSSTRRQLLEYLIACDVDGAFVVDMETRRMHSVGFEFPSGNTHAPGRRPGAWSTSALAAVGLGLAGLLVGAAIGAAWAAGAGVEVARWPTLAP